MIISTDDVSRQVVVVSFQATKLTAQAVYRALKKSLEELKQDILPERRRLLQPQKKLSGKQTVGQLVAQGEGATAIEIGNKNLQSFSRTLRKFNVDYAIQKDTSVYPPKYLVFFKAKDTDVISQAFREFIANQERGKAIDAEWSKDKPQTPQRSQNREKASIRKYLAEYKKQQEQDRLRNNRDRSVVKVGKTRSHDSPMRKAKKRDVSL